MAVMVAQNRVDYSVTKGGLRLWAVLIVFIVLCSSLYTIFSSRDPSDRTIDIGYSDSAESDDDSEINAEHGDDVSGRRERISSRLSHDNIVKSKVSTEYSSNDSDSDVDDDKEETDNDQDEAAAEVDDEDEDDEERQLAEREERLLAGLRSKAKRNKEGSKSLFEADQIPRSANAEQRLDRIIKKKSSQPMRKQVQNDKDQQPDEDADEQNNLNDNLKTKKSEKKLKQSLKAEDQEVSEVKDDDVEKAADTVDEELSGTDTEQSSDDDSKPSDSVGDGNELGTDERQDAEHSIKLRSKGKKKSKRQAVASSDRPRKHCKSGDCLTGSAQKPRMSLLKSIPPSSRRKQHKIRSTMDDIEDFDDDDEDVEELDGDLEDDDSDQPITDIDQAASNKSDKFHFDGTVYSDDAETIELFAAKKMESQTAFRRNAITNRDDQRFREQLDRADYLIEKHNFADGLEIFKRIIHQNPDSPRAHFGLARAHDIWAEIESDNSHLDIAINEYQQVLDIDDTPDALFKQAAHRLIDRSRFRGLLHRVLQAQRSLIDRYPDQLQLHNEFGLTFLMMGRNDDALRIFENVLKIDPTNAIAQSYYGYVLKLNGELELGVMYMRKGLRASRHVIADPRFYYHFGDALTRLGRKQEAHRVYGVGTKVGLFLSPYQRSLYNIDGLTAQPWWTVEQTACAKHLKNIEKQWVVIREEAGTLLAKHSNLFMVENRALIIDGMWSVYYLYRNDIWNETNCLRAPKTCLIMRTFKNSSNCLKSEIKFSLLTSGTHTWPHCGYTNCRLQAHLGLVVSSEARIRVANEIRGWRLGKFIIFDDSFEHEYWLHGASASKFRLILKLDLWHPEVDSTRRVQFQGV